MGKESEKSFAVYVTDRRLIKYIVDAKSQEEARRFVEVSEEANEEFSHKTLESEWHVDRVAKASGTSIVWRSADMDLQKVPKDILKALKAETASLDETVQDEKTGEASVINNEGFESQLEYLLNNGWTWTELRVVLELDVGSCDAPSATEKMLEEKIAEGVALGLDAAEIAGDLTFDILDRAPLCILIEKLVAMERRRLMEHKDE